MRQPKEIYASQRQLAARVALPDDKMKLLLEALAERGGKLSRTALANRLALAEVRIGFPPPIGDAVINDGPGLLLIVEKQPQGNTLDVTRNVEKALKQFDFKSKGIDVDPTIFRPATFIERSLERSANDGLREIDLLLQLPGFAELNAIKNDRLYIADGNQYFNRPGPRIVDSIEILAEIINPKQFIFGYEGDGWIKFSL